MNISEEVRRITKEAQDTQRPYNVWMLALADAFQRFADELQEKYGGKE